MKDFQLKFPIQNECVDLKLKIQTIGIEQQIIQYYTTPLKAYEFADLCQYVDQYIGLKVNDFNFVKKFEQQIIKVLQITDCFKPEALQPYFPQIFARKTDIHYLILGSGRNKELICELFSSFDRQCIEIIVNNTEERKLIEQFTRITPQLKGQSQLIIKYMEQLISNNNQSKESKIIHVQKEKREQNHQQNVIQNLQNCNIDFKKVCEQALIINEKQLEVYCQLRIDLHQYQQCKNQLSISNYQNASLKLERCIKVVSEYLRTIAYNTQEMERNKGKLSNIIKGVKKQGEYIIIVVRPTDLGILEFFDGQEIEHLNQANCELWGHNGVSNPVQIQKDTIFKNNCITTIYIK